MVELRQFTARSHSSILSYSYLAGGSNRVSLGLPLDVGLMEAIGRVPGTSLIAHSSSRGVLNWDFPDGSP